MRISRDEIKSAGQTIPKLKSCSIKPEPLWGDDAGRDTMDCNFSGTFKGWFTNIKLEIGRTTIEELNKIKQLIEKPITTLTYPLDRDLNGIKAGKAYTESFYGVAIETEFDNYKSDYEPFTINLIAVEGRPLDV